MIFYCSVENFSVFLIIPCSFECIFCLQRKRSLASHLSGYNPSKLYNTSSQKPDSSPEIIKEGITRKEHDDQDSAVRSKTISEETGSSDAALRGSDIVTFSRLSKLQLTSMKFLVPVVHRTRI